MSWTDAYRIPPFSTVNLNALPTKVDGDFEEKDAEAHTEKLIARLDELQEVLFAESKQSLLIVLQAMDTGGKDSTIRSVLGPLNPQGVRVWNFKAPSPKELAHDYLWRVHQRVPGDGYIGVFNRSHYEDVLVVRVKNLVAESIWSQRYDQINAFEQLLTSEGTRVVKFYLHISKDYQKERMQRRLDEPDKHWKFNPDDLKERARWNDYMRAYESAIGRCSTEHAPWYVVPAERRWFRNYLIAQVLVDTLESMDLKYPTATFDPRDIKIED